jgi:hypothetical protein
MSRETQIADADYAKNHAITFRELRDKLNSLNELQLNCTVTICIGDENADLYYVEDVLSYENDMSATLFANYYATSSNTHGEQTYFRTEEKADGNFDIIEITE